MKRVVIHTGKQILAIGDNKFKVGDDVTLSYIKGPYLVVIDAARLESLTEDKICYYDYDMGDKYTIDVSLLKNFKERFISDAEKAALNRSNL